MRPGQDPTTCFQEAGFLRDELERMGECVTEQSLKSFLIQKMAEEDKDALFASYREAKFDLGYTENTMRNLYLDNFSRRNATEGSIAGDGIPMAAQTTPGLGVNTCANCKEIGHYSYSCPSSFNNSGGSSDETDGNNNNLQTSDRGDGNGSNTTREIWRRRETKVALAAQLNHSQ